MPARRGSGAALGPVNGGMPGLSAEPGPGMVAADGEILHDHLYVLPMEGAGLILDSKIYSPETVFQIPAVVLNTTDIQAAHHFMKARSAEVAEIQFDKWFNFKDPDGNLLMICQS